MCSALAKVAERNDVEIVYPVHLNPNVKGPVEEYLGNKDIRDEEIEEIAIVSEKKGLELLTYDEDKKILKYVFNK